MTHQLPPASRALCLAFDLSMPVGPLELHEECHVSPTTVSFHGGRACGYTHGIFCKGLECKGADPAIHVATFLLSELVQDYGLNAASIWMRKPFSDFSAVPLFEYKSQTFAPHTTSYVTLAVNDADGSAWLVVAPSFHSGDKRAPEDEHRPQWYQHSKEEQDAWRKVAEEVWVHEFTVGAMAETTIGMPIPRVGLSLCATVSTKATIVPCPEKIKTALSTLNVTKGGSLSAIYYAPGI